jgi:hypothetical protein
MSATGASSASAASSLPLLDGALGRHLHRGAAGEQRAAAGAAEAVEAVGVALHDADAVERHAEHVDRQLRVAGGDALAHGLRGRADLDEAVGRDVDGDRSSSALPPVHSRKVAMPRPRSRPRAALSAWRAA